MGKKMLKKNAKMKKMFENDHLYEYVTFHKFGRHIFTLSWISIYETNRIYKGDLSVQLSTTQISKKWWTAQMLFKGNFQDLGKFWKILNFQKKKTNILYVDASSLLIGQTLV